MSWRVVVVSSNAKVDYKMDYLVVRTLEEVRRIHLSEVGVLVLESGDPAEIKWIDYVSLSLDDRKPQNRFQSLLQGAIREELAEQTNHLQQEIHSYLQKVTLHLDYPVCCTQGDYVQPLLKAIRYQPVLDGLEPLGRLAQYIELYSGLMKHQCFVLVGAHSYFPPASSRSCTEQLSIRNGSFCCWSLGSRISFRKKMWYCWTKIFASCILILHSSCCKLKLFDTAI